MPPRRASVRGEPSLRSLASCSTARAKRSCVRSSRLISNRRHAIPSPSSRPPAAKINARVIRAAFSAWKTSASRTSRSAGVSCNSEFSRSCAGCSCHSGTNHSASPARMASSTKDMSSRPGLRCRFSVSMTASSAAFPRDSQPFLAFASSALPATGTQTLSRTTHRYGSRGVFKDVSIGTTPRA